jgi:hypothetical protein
MRLRTRFLLVGLIFFLATFGLIAAENYNTSGRWVCAGACTIPDGNAASRATSLALGHSTMTGITAVTDGGTVTLDGYIQGQTLVSVIASGALTLNAVNVVTTAADADIPDGACDAAADVGNWVTVVVRDDSEAVSLTSDDASNTFIVPGLSLGAGDEVDSEGGATSNGDHITVVCSVAESWITTSMHGTWADGGAAD